MKLLIATGNAGKAREFAEMLGGSGMECADLTAAGAIHGTIAEPEETGATFLANVCLKATHYAAAAKCWALADDSGLEVDALDKSPGVKSARWAKLHDADGQLLSLKSTPVAVRPDSGMRSHSDRRLEQANPVPVDADQARAESSHLGRAESSPDQANNALLLKQLENVADADRTARFVCVLALADPQGRVVLTARDSVEGRLLRSPRGSNGFGYDPLFFIPEMSRTTAELSPAEKHAISHRGKAMKQLRKIIDETELFTSRSTNVPTTSGASFFQKTAAAQSGREQNQSSRPATMNLKSTPRTP